MAIAERALLNSAFELQHGYKVVNLTLVVDIKFAKDVMGRSSQPACRAQLFELDRVHVATLRSAIIPFKNSLKGRSTQLAACPGERPKEELIQAQAVLRAKVKHR